MFKIQILKHGDTISKDDICYIIGKNGIHLKKKIGLVDTIVPITLIECNDELQDVKPRLKLNINKIPESQFSEIICFFKKVYEVHQSEAIVLILYNQERKEFSFICPNQEVSQVSCKYDINKIEEETDKLSVLNDFDLIGSIHSHGKLQPHHSTTDSKDEKEWDGFHIIVGNLDEPAFSISVSSVINGYRFNLRPESYIDGLIEIKEEKIEDKELKSFNPKLYVLSHQGSYFDHSWMEKVKKITIEYYFTQGNETINGLKDLFSILELDSSGRNSMEKDKCEQCVYKNYFLKGCDK